MLLTDEHSERSSLLSRTGTFTSTSTIPGIGSVSGRVIKRLGQVVVNGVDTFIVRRRLGQIEEYVREEALSTDDREKVLECFDDLLEFSRSIYTFPVRERASRVIMAKIGKMNFEDLATALVSTGSVSVAYEHLSDVLGSDAATIPEEATMKRLLVHRTAALETYIAAFPRKQQNMPGFILHSAFLLYLAYVAGLGSPVYARIIVELDIINFLHDLGFFNPTHQVDAAIAGRLLLHVLTRKLQLESSSVAYQSVSSSLTELLQLSTATDNLSNREWIKSLTQRNSETSFSWSWTDQDSLTPFDIAAVVKNAIIHLETCELHNVAADSGPEIPNLLLLGTGECGKSTMLKQLLLSQASLDKYLDISGFAGLVGAEAIYSLRKIVCHSLDHDNYSWAKRASRSILEKFQGELDAYGDFPIEVDIINLMRTVERYVEVFHLMKGLVRDEKTDYYLDLLGALHRSRSPIYIPSNQDILQCYVTTLGIKDETIIIEGETYRVFDVGGQRSERKKWIHCFPDASIVVFVASLSEYDQVLMEDPSINRLSESLILFEAVAHTHWLTNVPMVLLLNKKDVLERKIAKSPIVDFFPDYAGGTDVEAACDYFVQRFLSVSKHPEMPVHILSAVEGDEVQG
ncbi:guanine nucleotide-binding protein subunit alpha [Moniliophthora roreri MCA 2997]|uniref:Guanine nucleotide-binding protein subunit alpha n=1 Tax=Moniliophthora roreri (strain MCA 2997) TaxID=1381753 RepID=V2WVY0_MONRO|nr:guanine nucleotide-binding protein subunit alpha [Moniliophthora roreri MCA 2997]